MHGCALTQNGYVALSDASKIVTAYIILTFCMGLLLTFYFLQELCGSCMLLFVDFFHGLLIKFLEYTIKEQI